jgi:hypothetical protein
VENLMTRVLISYRNITGQSDFAYALEEELSKAGVDTWIDKDVLGPGQAWEDVIYAGIINSDYVVLCLSPEYFASEICLIECYVARGYGKKLLPIVVPFEGMGQEDKLDDKVRAIISELRQMEAAHNFRYSPFAIISELLNRYVETQGIDHFNILNFNDTSVVGFVESYDEKIQRLVRSVQSPTTADLDYEVYISFRTDDVTFATQIADDLNAKRYNTFISTRGVDIGANWRHVHWSAMLRAKFHIVILSPGVINSDYVKNELRITKTKKERVLLPVLSAKIGKDETARSAIRNAEFLADVNRIQWFNLDDGYDTFINNLIKFIEGKRHGS